MNICKLCSRETDRVGWPHDGMCTNCWYCHDYGHVDETNCLRCGYPAYASPPRLATEVD